MNTLLFSLKALVATFIVDCLIDERANSNGYRVTFKYVIPSLCLNKLVAFCNLYSLSFYISADNDRLLFNIYRDVH